MNDTAVQILPVRRPDIMLRFFLCLRLQTSSCFIGIREKEKHLIFISAIKKTENK